MNTYGVIPSEETLFKDTIILNVGTQLPTQQNIKDSLRLKVGTNFKRDLHDLISSLPLQYDVPIKYKSLILNFSLDTIGITDIIKLIKIYMPSHIILSGKSSYINNYNDYARELQDYISKINKIPYTNIVLKNDTYLQEILNDSKKYNVESFTTERYGVCASDKLSMIKLLNYKINQDVLKAITDKVNLSVETDSTCSPSEGVSNTLESVLWLLDFLFQINLANIYSTTIHMENYNNIYALLAYQYGTQDSAVLYSSETLKQNITYYLTKNLKKNIYYLTVINKDTDNNYRINFNIESDLPATLYRLVSNQGAGGKGGLSFGELTLLDNVLKSARTGDTSKDLTGVEITPTDNMYSFIVPKLSAIVLDIPLTISGGAFFEDINDSQERDAVITVQPDIYDMNAPLTMSVRNFRREFS